MADLEQVLSNLTANGDETNALLAQLVEKQDRMVRIAEDRKSEASSGGGSAAAVAGGAGGGRSGGSGGGLKGAAGDLAVAASNPSESIASTLFEKARAGLSAVFGNDRAADFAFNAGGGRELSFEVQSAEAQTRGIIGRRAELGIQSSDEEIRGTFADAQRRAARISEANRNVTSVINQELTGLGAVAKKLDDLVTETKRQTQIQEQQKEALSGD